MGIAFHQLECVCVTGLFQLAISQVQALWVPFDLGGKRVILSRFRAETDRDLELSQQKTNPEEKLPAGPFARVHPELSHEI